MWILPAVRQHGVNLNELCADLRFFLALIGQPADETQGFATRYRDFMRCRFYDNFRTGRDNSENLCGSIDVSDMGFTDPNRQITGFCPGEIAYAEVFVMGLADFLKQVEVYPGTEMLPV